MRKRELVDFFCLPDSCDCLSSAALRHGAVVWSEVCDFGISGSYFIESITYHFFFDEIDCVHLFQRVQ